jgi:hypothetical protein
VIVQGPRVLASTWLPLEFAALCLDDETVFDLRERECPACGATTWALLATWLKERAR